jgi:hypothetical protein
MYVPAAVALQGSQPPPRPHVCSAAEGAITRDVSERSYGCLPVQICEDVGGFRRAVVSEYWPEIFVPNSQFMPVLSIHLAVQVLIFNHV